MSDLATRDAAAALPPDPAAQALKALPAEYRKAVGYLWALNAHLLPTPTPLAMRFQVWIRHEGLTPEDCRAAVRGVTRAEAQAGHRFAADLLADLSGAVASALGRRRSREAAAKRAAEDDPANRATPAELEALREMTADLFKAAPKGPVRP